MDDLPPGSRLAVVRSQLSIDSDSEESTATTAASSADTEPFPEYDESECEQIASSIAAEKPREEAWIYACGKAAQQHIRLHEVDPNIIPYFHSDPSQHSQVVLEQLQDLLAEPQMRPVTRRQFITLVNTTLKLNLIIFHQSPEFLAPDETSQAKSITNQILYDLTWMEGLLKEQVQTANQITVVFEQTLLDDVPAFDQLRNMASLVTRSLKKPRTLEQRLLALYADMYEEWVHAPFFRLRSRQVLNEKIANVSRAELSRQIIPISDVLTRCIESYGVFTWATMELKKQYFTPTMDYLCNSPEIWRKCWEEHQETEREQCKPTEKEPFNLPTL